MPVAQASDGVPLCLLGKRSRIALNPEPRQFLRFFDFEAETIETRSLRHAAALPANRRGANRQGAALDAVPGGLLPPSRSGSIPWGDRDIGGYQDASSSVQQALGHDEQGCPGDSFPSPNGVGHIPRGAVLSQSAWHKRGT